MAKVDYTTYDTHIRGTIKGIPKIRGYSIDLLAGSVKIRNATAMSTIVTTIRRTKCKTALGSTGGRERKVGRDRRGYTRSTLGSERAPGVGEHLVTSLYFLVPLVCLSVKRVV